MRTISQLYQNNGFINFIDSYNALHGKWVHNTDAPVCDLNLLDNYILLTIGNSKLARIVDNDKIYDSVRTCLNANEYKLNSMWDSTLLEYNPIENYDRYEEETTDGTSNNGARSTTVNNGARLTTINNGAREESVENGERSTTINAGEHKTLTKVGEREQTNSNGAQSNTNISSNKTTAFDSTDYGKATDKTETTDTTQAYTDTIHTDEATDTTTQNAYTDSTSQDAYTDTTKVKASTDTTSQSATTDITSQNAYTDTNNAHRVAHIHGNIGVIDSATMIGNYRKISNYNFYDKIVEILEQYITEMNYEMEDF